jgi:hypothetical protein
MRNGSFALKAEKLKSISGMGRNDRCPVHIDAQQRVPPECWPTLRLTDKSAFQFQMGRTRSIRVQECAG